MRTLEIALVMTAASNAGQLFWDDGIPYEYIFTEDEFQYAISFESAGFVAEYLLLNAEAEAEWNLEIRIYSFPDDPTLWFPNLVDWSSPVLWDTTVSATPAYLDGWALIELPSLALDDITWVAMHGPGGAGKHIDIQYDEYPTPEGPGPVYFHSYAGAYPVPYPDS